MFDHVTIRVSDRRASERFYAAVLVEAGIERTHSGPAFAEWEDFSLAAATSDRRPTRRLHIGFAARSREHVERFWRAGVDAGHPDAGPPGPRPQYTEDYFGAFLLDPDGNSVEAVHHGGLRRGGVVDHLWMRVADPTASRRFYATIAPHAGLRVRTDTDERVSFTGGDGSFSVVAGRPTERVHLAFPAGDDAVVRAFHAAAVSAGYADNGPPGPRPEYHEGYYAAFVLDPDGNNVEVVNHNRRLSAGGSGS